MTMNSSTKVGVALLSIFAVASAIDGTPNKNRRLLRKGGGRKLNRKNSNQRLATKNRNNNIDNDITEDVAFWTRTLQSSLPPTPPTPGTPAPTPAPTPMPQSAATPNPTDGAPGPSPTDPPGSETGTPTYAPTEEEGDTPAPVPSPPAGDLPVANDDAATLSSGGDFAFIAVLDNDIPEAGETLIVQSIEKQADNGECTISLDLVEMTYMPDPSFSGVDTCIYEACDSVPNCDTATVTFTVG